MKKHLSTQTRKRMLSSIGLILFSVSFVLAQVLVKGTVKDNLGEGVPGASVQVKGTSQGTITDLDGKFAFNVPNKNSILVISFIGYVTVEMKVDTQIKGRHKDIGRSGSSRLSGNTQERPDGFCCQSQHGRTA